MLKNNMLRIVFPVFSLLVFSFFPHSASALGQKAVRDPSYYLHNLRDPNTPQEEKEVVYKPEAILIKCSNIDKYATGIAVLETGEFYAIARDESLSTVKLEKLPLLKTNIERTKPLFEYAHQIGLENISFFSKIPETDLCVTEYRKEDKVTKTRWIKHPYLRETDPPPEELIILFEDIQKAVLAKEDEK